MRVLLAAVAAGAVGGPGAAGLAQPTSVVNGPHNLSAGGPGPIRAAAEPEVCIFCHTPHNASPILPLWNRSTPVEAYTIYSSRTLEAQPGQPTGMSKMCLSCHDGTIALGSVLSRGTPIPLAAGITTLPPGASNVGTDLSDDHPISFRYDGALASRDPKIKHPSMLPPAVRLDSNSELQCTSCHNAHNDSLGKFLVMRNTNSELCLACHQVGTTTVASHGDCAACHQPHTAPSGPYLLRGGTIRETCLRCHDGSHPGSPDVSADLSKVFTHDTNSRVDPPEPIVDHVACTDCHEPHTMTPGTGQPPNIHGDFGRVSGMSASGSAVQAATDEFQVCFKCHADGSTRRPWVPRVVIQNNTRLQFSPSAVSFHPVEAPGRSASVPSLKPGWTVGSMVYCSSCHGSDTGRSFGGSGPDGVHGSAFAPVLVARYETADRISESAQAYALCYRCHERGSILADESFTSHKEHVEVAKASCAACHDAHGIASAQGTSTKNSHLINFDTRVVAPDPVTGRLEYVNQGMLRGACYLRCHGQNHSPKSYP